MSVAAQRESQMSDDPIHRHVNPKDLKLGPIRHEELTEGQLERVRMIYQCVGPFIGTPFEQFELNFLRDTHPEREIHIWSCIVFAHQKFLMRKPNISMAEVRRAFYCILLISMGATRPDDIPAPLWESLEGIYDGKLI